MDKCQSLIQEADKICIVARAQHEAKVEGGKPVKCTTSKSSTTNKMETRAGTRKSPRREMSVTEDSPGQKQIRAEVKQAKIKQADKVNKL